MKLTSEAQQRLPSGPATYPSLWYSSVNDMVVLMTERRRGIVVKASNAVSSYHIGYYSDTWDMPCFEPFYGTVTLKSEAA